MNNHVETIARTVKFWEKKLPETGAWMSALGWVQLKPGQKTGLKKALVLKGLRRREK